MTGARPVSGKPGIITDPRRRAGRSASGRGRDRRRPKPQPADVSRDAPFRRSLPRNPMALTPSDVQRIAELARLELDPSERAAALGQLNGFFDIVERMRAVDTRGVEPLYTPLAAVRPVRLRLRGDAVTESDAREANQRSAPAVQDGLYLVPRVIE
jgi:aspartyl-tRNA(Asn)/glutamyl-tRNA(Gln) amidotransferase subunit C